MIRNIGHLLAVACDDCGIELGRRELDALAARLVEILDIDRDGCESCGGTATWAFEWLSSDGSLEGTSSEACGVCGGSGR